MRLSDIRGERTFEVIAEIIEPIANIASDETSSEFFRREKLPEGVSAKDFLLKRAKKSIPSLLKGHKKDLIVILAALDGVDKDEYSESLNLLKLIRDVTELLTDEAFAELFISAQSEKENNASGSAPENTEGPKA